jgi:hypothetical protein
VLSCVVGGKGKESVLLVEVRRALGGSECPPSECMDDVYMSHKSRKVIFNNGMDNTLVSETNVGRQCLQYLIIKRSLICVYDSSLSLREARHSYSPSPSVARPSERRSHDEPAMNVGHGIIQSNRIIKYTLLE